MRERVVIGLNVLFSAKAVGDDRTIPQDTARMEKRSRDRLAPWPISPMTRTNR